MAKQKIVEKKSVEITTLPGGTVQTVALFDPLSFGPGGSSVNNSNSTFFIDVTALIFNDAHTSLSGGFKCLQHFVYRNGTSATRAMINTSTFDRPTCWYYPDDSGITFIYRLRNSNFAINSGVFPIPGTVYTGYDQVVGQIEQNDGFDDPVRILLSWEVTFYKDV